jgi:hypothetical protein
MLKNLILIRHFGSIHHFCIIWQNMSLPVKMQSHCKRLNAKMLQILNVMLLFDISDAILTLIKNENVKYVRSKCKLKQKIERKKVQNHEKPVFSHFENLHHFENLVMWQKQHILRCVIFCNWIVCFFDILPPKNSRWRPIWLFFSSKIDWMDIFTSEKSFF